MRGVAGCQVAVSVGVRGFSDVAKRGVRVERLRRGHSQSRGCLSSVWSDLERRVNSLSVHLSAMRAQYVPPGSNAKAVDLLSCGDGSDPPDGRVGHQRYVNAGRMKRWASGG